MIKWSEEAKKESDNPFVLSLFFPLFPCSSLLPLRYGKHILLLQAETCGDVQDGQRFYQANKTELQTKQ